MDVEKLIKEFKDKSGEVAVAGKFLKLGGGFEKLATFAEGAGAVAYLFCLWASFYVKLPPSQRQLVNAIGIQAGLNTLAGVPIDIGTAIAVQNFGTHHKLVARDQLRPDIINAFSSAA